LLKKGYDVTGVFIRVWHPDFIVCNEEAERLDAMRVAATLRIPFLTFDAQEVYKKWVADYMIEEYRKGNTPNPDVMCNREVKFGAFYEFAKKNGADFIATGHYARREEGKLLRGVDPLKDQSYFLWTIKKEELPSILFPVGETIKTDLRREAKKAGLPTAEKRDSQGICFLGKIDMKDFLSHYIETTPGAILEQKGERIGTHDGALFYTLGQRHGFTIDGGSDNTPHYVVSKNLENNTITVSDTHPAPTARTYTLLQPNFLVSTEAILGKQITVQTRYRQTPMRATLEREGEDYVVKLEDATELGSPGQSVVFYKEDQCLGGGIIS
jgi:tRNA-specific 2-thiouridylase